MSSHAYFKHARRVARDASIELVIGANVVTSSPGFGIVHRAASNLGSLKVDKGLLVLSMVRSIGPVQHVRASTPIQLRVLVRKTRFMAKASHGESHLVSMTVNQLLTHRE